jgi:hypothetical protein
MCSFSPLAARQTQFRIVIVGLLGLIEVKQQTLSTFSRNLTKVVCLMRVFNKVIDVFVRKITDPVGSASCIMAEHSGIPNKE